VFPKSKSIPKTFLSLFIKSRVATDLICEERREKIVECSRKDEEERKRKNKVRKHVNEVGQMNITGF
jgi:hypothetical protein